MNKIPNFFIDFARYDFTCPHCQKMHEDTNLKYFNKINRNKSWITKVKCECGKTFKLTVNYKGDFETFKKLPMQEFRIKKVTIERGETYYQPQIKQDEKWMYYSTNDKGEYCFSEINGHFYWSLDSCIKFIKSMSDATAYWKQLNVEYIPFTKEIAESCQ